MITQINTDKRMMNTDIFYLCSSKERFYELSVFISVKKGM